MRFSLVRKSKAKKSHERMGKIVNDGLKEEKAS